MTEAQLIHEGWHCWTWPVSSMVQWQQELEETRAYCAKRWAEVNKPATKLYCKPHQRDDAMRLLNVTV